MCPARLSEVTPCGGSPRKQNIFELAFTWYPIRHSIPNTTQNIQLLNSSDFSETPGIISGELFESVGVEVPILLSYTYKNEWDTHGGLPTRCQRSAMGVSLIFVGVRQQNGCFDTHTFIQFSTYARYIFIFTYISLSHILRIFLPMFSMVLYTCLKHTIVCSFSVALFLLVP